LDGQVISKISTRNRFLVLIAVLIIGIGVATALFAVSGGNTETFQIPSEAMRPTITEEDFVTVDLDAYKDSDPSINDIVVFYPPLGADGVGMECGVAHERSQACPEPTPDLSEQKFIKRIVAGPGDEIYIADGHPVVNGETAEEDFVKPCSGGSCDMPDPITIPPDHYFMLGDNRGASADSRFWGPVPRDALIGEVTEINGEQAP
jgi:signal peptidase I